MLIFVLQFNPRALIIASSLPETLHKIQEWNNYIFYTSLNFNSQTHYRSSDCKKIIKQISLALKAYLRVVPAAKKSATTSTHSQSAQTQFPAQCNYNNRALDCRRRVCKKVQRVAPSVSAAEDPRGSTDVTGKRWKFAAAAVVQESWERFLQQHTLIQLSRRGPKTLNSRKAPSKRAGRALAPVMPAPRWLLPLLLVSAASAGECPVASGTTHTAPKAFPIPKTLSGQSFSSFFLLAVWIVIGAKILERMFNG